MDQYIKNLDEQIDAVYRTSGGPEPVMFANIEAKALSAKFIARLGKRKSCSVHVKRQMDLCLVTIEQAKDAAAKALMMPEVEEEKHMIEEPTKKAKVEEPAKKECGFQEWGPNNPSPCKTMINASERACASCLPDLLATEDHLEKHKRVCKKNGYGGYGGSCCDNPSAVGEEPAAAAAASWSSFQKHRACGHDQRGPNKVAPCKKLIHPKLIACADCMPDVIAGRAAKACPHGSEKHFDKSGCPDCKIQKERDSELAASSSSVPRSTLHVIKVKLGESYCAGCDGWGTGWSVLASNPMRISCDVCNKAKLFVREDFREVDEKPEAVETA